MGNDTKYACNIGHIYYLMKKVNGCSKGIGLVNKLKKKLYRKIKKVTNFF